MRSISWPGLTKLKRGFFDQQLARTDAPYLIGLGIMAFANGRKPYGIARLAAYAIGKLIVKHLKEEKKPQWQ